MNLHLLDDYAWLKDGSDAEDDNERRFPDAVTLTNPLEPRLEEELQQQQLTDEQRHVIQGLYQRKYDQEKAKQEHRLLKQYVHEKKLPPLLQAIPIIVPSCITAIEDETIRQRLSDRHQQILHSYQSDMFIILIRLSQLDLAERQKLFDQDLASMWQQQRTLPTDERFSSSIITCMEAHLVTITEQLQVLYNEKMQHLFGHF